MTNTLFAVHIDRGEDENFSTDFIGIFSTLDKANEAGKKASSQWKDDFLYSNAYHYVTPCVVDEEIN